MAYRWKKLVELQLQPNYEKFFFIILCNGINSIFIEADFYNDEKSIWTQYSGIDDFLIFEDFSIYLY